MYNDLCSSNTYYQNFSDFQYENSYDIDINSWASTASKSTAVNVITHGIGIYTNLPKNRRTLDIYKQGKFPTTFHNKPVTFGVEILEEINMFQVHLLMQNLSDSHKPFKNLKC